MTSRDLDLGASARHERQKLEAVEDAAAALARAVEWSGRHVTRGTARCVRR